MKKSSSRSHHPFLEPIVNPVRGQETIWENREFPGIECTAAEDMARQEYKLESDLSYQMARFGVGMPHTYGEVDYDQMDLQTSLQAVEAAHQAWFRLPQVVRDRYRSWANVEAAARSGELEQVLKAAGVPPAVGGSPVASASDSAPVQGDKPV